MSEMKTIRRSDGNRWLAASNVAGVLGVLCFLGAVYFAFTGTTNPSGVAARNALSWLSSVLLSLWFACLAIGGIVRAIYFLPGETTKPPSRN